MKKEKLGTREKPAQNNLAKGKTIDQLFMESLIPKHPTKPVIDIREGKKAPAKKPRDFYWYN